MAHDHHRAAIEAGQARNNGWVITKAAIAVELVKICAEHLNEVERVGPLWVPRHL